MVQFPMWIKQSLSLQTSCSSDSAAISWWRETGFGGKLSCPAFVYFFWSAHCLLLLHSYKMWLFPTSSPTPFQKINKERKRPLLNIPFLENLYPCRKKTSFETQPLPSTKLFLSPLCRLPSQLGERVQLGPLAKPPSDHQPQDKYVSLDNHFTNNNQKVCWDVISLSC